MTPEDFLVYSFGIATISVAVLILAMAWEHFFR